MEEIFDEYNALIQEMADAVAEATDEKEAEKIQAKYDKKVEEADKVLEAKLEEAFKKANEELAKEQAESELAIPIEKEDTIIKPNNNKEELFYKLKKYEQWALIESVCKEKGISSPKRNELKLEKQRVDWLIKNT